MSRFRALKTFGVVQKNPAEFKEIEISARVANHHYELSVTDMNVGEVANIVNTAERYKSIVVEVVTVRVSADMIDDQQHPRSADGTFDDARIPVNEGVVLGGAAAVPQ